MDSIARGLTNYDASGSALIVSNSFTNASALASTALQPASTNGAEWGSHASFLTNIPYYSVEAFSTAVGNTSDGSSFGTAYGYNANGSTFGVAVGSSAFGSSYGVGVGVLSAGSGRGNVAIGYMADAMGESQSFTNTTEIGTGTAVSNGWFHYRGIPIIDETGVLHGSGSSLTGINAAQVGAVSTSGVTSIIYSNPASFVSTNTIIRGTGFLLIGESGSTSILYHVTSGNHTNQIGSYYTE